MCITVVRLIQDTLEITSLYKGQKFLAASTVTACGAPLTKRHLSNKDRFFWQKVCPC